MCDLQTDVKETIVEFINDYDFSTLFEEGYSELINGLTNAESWEVLVSDICVEDLEYEEEDDNLFIAECSIKMNIRCYFDQSFKRSGIDGKRVLKEYTNVCITDIRFDINKKDQDYIIEDCNLSIEKLIL